MDPPIDSSAPARPDLPGADDRCCECGDGTAWDERLFRCGEIEDRGVARPGGRLVTHYACSPECTDHRVHWLCWGCAAKTELIVADNA